MKPNATAHNPSPDYLRGLLERAGLKQQQAAAQLGLSPRVMRYYLSTADDHRDAPYLVQYALEQLAGPSA